MEENEIRRRAIGGVADACALVRTIGRDDVSFAMIRQMDTGELVAATILLANMVVHAAAELGLTPDQFADRMLERFAP